MILIADCGSTKIDWCAVDGDQVVVRFETPGMNALMLTQEEMTERIKDEVAPQLPQGIEHVYFYGAGCVSPEVCGHVAAAIKDNIGDVEVDVASDLLAAARALCQDQPGIACIMGTGSNSCYYDGEKIVQNVPALGYILGDEGSGACLGKALVGNVLKGQLPEHICKKFLEDYELTMLDIIDRVYRKPQANRFLASLSRFIHDNMDASWELYVMAQEEFKRFFKRNIMGYAKQFGINDEPCTLDTFEVTEDWEPVAVNFVGSIAYYYQEILESIAPDFGCRIGKVLKAPMEGLIQYHASK